jgi:hypothetical protein
MNYDLIASVCKHPHLARGKVRDKRTSSSTLKQVLTMMCVHANAQGQCWPSVPTLVEETGLAERTVQTALEIAEKHFYFTVLERPVRNRAGRYQMHPQQGQPILELSQVKEMAAGDAGIYDKMPAGDAGISEVKPQEMREFPQETAGHARRKLQNPPASPYRGSTSNNEVPFELPEVNSNCEVVASAVSTRETPPPQENKSSQRQRQNTASSIEEMRALLVKLFELETDTALSLRDKQQLNRSIAWLRSIEATPADVVEWHARWDYPKPPYLSQLKEKDWHRLMPEWVSPAARREAETRRREEQAKAAQKAEAERREAEEKAAEDAELDARYEAMPVEEKAQLNDLVKSRFTAAGNVIQTRVPDRVLAYSRREALRDGWEFDPDAMPRHNELPENELPEYHAFKPPRPECIERRDAVTNRSQVSRAEYLERMKAKAAALAKAAAPEDVDDIMAALDLDSSARQETLRAARRAA